MLRLLPNVLYSKISERRLFLQDLFILVFSVHCIFFGSMFLMSIMHKTQNKFTISMHQTGATYVLMPFQKKVDSAGTQFSKNSSDAARKSQVIAYEEYLERKKQGKQVRKAAVVSKQASSKTQETIEKNSTTKSKSKATTILADKKYINKKLQHKKTFTKKQKKQKKNKIKIVEKLQHESPQHLEQQVPVVTQAEIVQPQETVTPAADEQSTADTTLSAVSDNVIFVGYEQFDECVISSKIQHAITQSWTPPVGLDSHMCCELKIIVSADGMADVVEITKPSGVLVFDMSARAALQQIEFPQEVYGKTIAIALGN